MSHGILVFAMAAAVWAQSVRIDGNWQGVLGGSVRVGLRIAKSNTGDYIGTLDVIDQAKSGVPVQQITLAGADLHFAVPSLNAKYDGSLNADATEITGILSDAAPVPGRTSVSRPLNFKRAAAVDTFNRMQNPQAPFAYNSVEVAADKVKAEWAGTKADFPKSVGNVEMSDAYVERLLTGFNTAEVRSALNSDPAETLRQLTIPVLALNGSRDLQVPPQRNLSAIVAALSIGRNPDFTAAIIPGLNHMFQTCKDCSLDEYGKLGETFSPETLEMMSAWLLHHVR